MIERTLSIVDGSTIQKMKIGINFPRKQAAGDFKCDFAIAWPDKPVSGTMYGVDAVQSLILSMNMIAFHLYRSNYHKERRMFWERIGDGYGFPLSQDFKSLAEGSDASL
jgi:hypothetical protein